MTVPFKYPDFAPASQTGEAEWQTFQRRQQQLLDSIATHTALENAKAQQAGGVAPNGMLTPSQEFLNNMASSEGPVAGAGRSFDTNFDTGQPRDGMSTGDYEHLLQAAHWWNIESPESMNPQALAAEVKKKEIGFQGERGYQTHLSDIPTEVTAFTTAAASGLANTMANVVGDVKELPFVGDNLAKLVNSEKGVEWLRRLGRNIGSVAYGMGQALPTDWDNGSFSAIRATGEFGGEAVPAYFAWEAIGAAGGVSALGKIGGRLTAFQRAGMMAVRAAQGVGTAMLLEAGSNKSQAEKNQTYVAGGLLAGALEGAGQALSPILARVIPRVRSALGIPQVMEGPRMDGFGPAYTSPEGRGVTRYGADWSFIDEGPIPPRGAPPALPPGGGGTPLLTAPIEGPGTGLPAGRQPLGLQRPGELPALPRPANPSDVVEATYGGPEDEWLVSHASLGPFSQVTPIENSITNAGAMQVYDAYAATGKPYMDPNYTIGYLTNKGRFVLAEEANAIKATMHPTELERLSGHFDEVWNAEARSADYGSKRFLEGKPSQTPSSSVLALTRIRHPETGMPERMYHGTGAVYDQPKTFDAPSNPENQLFGPGYYTTNNPEIASGYPPELSHSDIQYYSDYLERLRDDQKQFLSGDRDARLRLANLYGKDPYASDEIAVALQESINFNHDQLQKLISVRPNVRPQYLDIRNPFDIDAPYTEQHIEAIALAMQKNKVPDNAIQTFIKNALDPHEVVDFNDLGDPTRINLGETLYSLLQGQMHNDPTVGIPAMGEGYIPVDADPNSLNSFNQPVAMIGKALANKILEDAGFDGITHIGGFRTGNEAHRVAIAFRASQVHPAYEPTVLESLEAERLAAQMNRQQIVMDSPDLPELAGKPTLNDGDVAEAAVKANPGGVTIIKSVGMPADVMEGLKSGDVRFAITKRGNLDALVGNVTPEMAADYQEFGMFRGQRAVTSSGREIVITEPGHDYVTAVEVGVPNVDALTIPRDQITLGRSGMDRIEAPAEWDEFRQNTLEYANAEARKAGMQPVEDMRDYRVASILQNRIDQHLESFSPAEKQVMTKYFEQRWAREFRDGVPQDAELESTASIMANEAYAETAIDAPPPAIEDVAESKGFVWHPSAGEGGRMEDLVGGEDLPVFSSDEAARTFLANVDRELPDLAPPSDVPLEAMQHGPASQSGSALESGPGLAGPERELENWMEGVEAADADYGAEDLGGGVGSGGGAGGAGGGGGGIGGPPDEPNPWSDPLGPQLGPEVPGLGQRLANKIHMFMEANPDQYALWRQQILESIVWKNRPTRYKFLAYEEHLNKIGATGNRVWDMVDNLFTALTQSHNEATPWHRRASSILAKLPRKFMRSGDFVRVHELTDGADQERVWGIIKDRYGWSDAKYQQVREASAEVKQFYRDLFALKSGDPRTGLTAEREIWNYIPRLRAAQAAGRFQVDGDINPLIEDFATYAREGMLQMRQMHIGDLMYHSVNATFNAKYVAEPYAELVSTWQHPGIPEEIKEPVLGLARLARYGQDMGHSAAVRGVKAIFRTLGVPINTKEASSMLNTPMTWNYKSILGGRPSVLFRDAIQPLKAGLKVGMPKVMDIYRRAFSSPAFKAEMIDQGIKGGWVEVDRAQFEGAGLMEHTATATRNAQGEVIGSNLDMGAITRGQIARRETLASVGDVIRDAIPIRLRQASETLDPLRPYAKVSGLWNRAIAGRAGWETASGAISEFRAAQRAAIFEGAEAPTMDSLMENSAAGSFEPAIRRKFQGFIDAGQDEEAANLIARQVADWSQGRYGTKETMQFNRGYTGRLVMQFGNFAPQELESVISMARNGSAAQRTKGLLGYSAINAAMYAAEAYTGWRFGKWAWAQGIAFGGGPAIDPAIQAIQAARGMAATVGGSTPSPDATTAVQRYARTKPEDILAPFNPYQGVLSTVDQLVQAMQGVNPAEQIARYTITGDRGGNIDWQRQLEAAQRPTNYDPRYAIPPALTKEELLRRMHQPPAQPAPPRAGAMQ